MKHLSLEAKRAAWANVHKDCRTRAETLEGRLACETALVDTLRAENARLRAALEAAARSLDVAQSIADGAYNARLMMAAHLAARRALDGAR